MRVMMNDRCLQKLYVCVSGCEIFVIVE